MSVQINVLLNVNFTLSDDIHFLTHFQGSVQRNTIPCPQQAAVILETADICLHKEGDNIPSVIKIQVAILRKLESKNLKILSQMICLVWSIWLKMKIK